MRLMSLPSRGFASTTSTYLLILAQQSKKVRELDALEKGKWSEDKR